jgi:hypothetical protein
LQAGGHRFDPGQLHQIIICCFEIGAIAMASISKQVRFGEQVSAASGLDLFGERRDMDV